MDEQRFPAEGLHVRRPGLLKAVLLPPGPQGSIVPRSQSPCFLRPRWPHLTELQVLTQAVISCLDADDPVSSSYMCSPSRTSIVSWLSKLWQVWGSSWLMLQIVYSFFILCRHCTLHQVIAVYMGFYYQDLISSFYSFHNTKDFLVKFQTLTFWKSTKLISLFLKVWGQYVMYEIINELTFSSPLLWLLWQSPSFFLLVNGNVKKLNVLSKVTVSKGIYHRVSGMRCWAPACLALPTAWLLKTSDVTDSSPSCCYVRCPQVTISRPRSSESGGSVEVLATVLGHDSHSYKAD